jgi:hypothetical protein
VCYCGDTFLMFIAFCAGPLYLKVFTFDNLADP